MGGPLGSRRLPRAIFLLLTVALIGGCAAKSNADTSRPPNLAVGATPTVAPSTAAAPTNAPKVAAARAAALTAYRAYIQYSTLAAQTADFDSQQLSRYAIDPLLGQWVISVNAMYQQGLVQRGAVVDPNPTVTDLRLFTKDGTPQGTATIADCLDNTGITYIDALKRDVVANDKAHPYLSSVAHAEMYPDGRWVIASVDTEDVTSC